MTADFHRITSASSFFSPTLLLEKYLTEDDYEIRAMIGSDLYSSSIRKCLLASAMGRNRLRKIRTNAIPGYPD